VCVLLYQEDRALQALRCAYQTGTTISCSMSEMLPNLQRQSRGSCTWQTSARVLHGSPEWLRTITTWLGEGSTTAVPTAGGAAARTAATHVEGNVPHAWRTSLGCASDLPLARPAMTAQRLACLYWLGVAYGLFVLLAL
jgi:hypothetical protein